VFTGTEGKQVPVEDTVRGFKEILEGKHDEVPETNFYMKGGIAEVEAAPGAERGNTAETAKPRGMQPAEAKPAAKGKGEPVGK
jgi:F-type H+/Na+-transporting ATPase subunit beta